MLVLANFGSNHSRLTGSDRRIHSRCKSRRHEASQTTARYEGHKVHTTGPLVRCLCVFRVVLWLIHRLQLTTS